ncbi:hypothetical protein Prudu_477S000100, partial [Prunus dulcis]
IFIPVFLSLSPRHLSLLLLSPARDPPSLLPSDRARPSTGHGDLRHRSLSTQHVAAFLAWAVADISSPDIGRNLPFSPTVVIELPLDRSLLFRHHFFEEAPGVRLIHKRDPREVQLARTSSLRRTKETALGHQLSSRPPPKRFSETVGQVEDFGFGQNTGETLRIFGRSERKI